MVRAEEVAGPAGNMSVVPAYGGQALNPAKGASPPPEADRLSALPRSHGDSGGHPLKPLPEGRASAEGGQTPPAAGRFSGLSLETDALTLHLRWMPSPRRPIGQSLLQL